MQEVRCSFCGSEEWQELKIEYLYSYKGRYLIVPDMPVEICTNCGMIYYDAATLKEVERRFFAIQDHAEEPDRYVEVPEKAFAAG